jgi:hypothetical protein
MQRFEDGVRRFRSQRAVRVTLGALFFVATAALVWEMRDPTWPSFWRGFAGGIFLFAYAWLRDSPPEYIERWRRGAEAERRTGRALDRLRKAGWIVVHDLPWGHGNLDHVLVGPPGVFVVDTKELGGIATVEQGVVRVQRRMYDDAEYTLESLAATSRRNAYQLKTELERRTGIRTWVQAAVVFWNEFEQKEVEQERVSFLHGGVMTEWLNSRPRKLDPNTVQRLAAELTVLEAVGARA